MKTRNILFATVAGTTAMTLFSTWCHEKKIKISESRGYWGKWFTEQFLEYKNHRQRWQDGFCISQRALLLPLFTNYFSSIQNLKLMCLMTLVWD